jgi:hypothetical protein
VQVEVGKRAESTLEVAKLAALYGRKIASFLSGSPADAEYPLVALFRAAESLHADSAWQMEVSRYLAICRAGVELERLLDRSAHRGATHLRSASPAANDGSG